MRKIWLLVFILITVVGVSCGYQKSLTADVSDIKSKVTWSPRKKEAELPMRASVNSVALNDLLTKAKTIPAPPPDDEKFASPEPSISSYDPVELDYTLLKYALAQKIEIKDARMILHQRSDGTKVYWELGRFVLVNPLQKVSYLPVNL